MQAGKFELDLEDLVEAFEDLEDPRSHINREHPLASVLTIAIMGILAGHGGPSGIADWANFQEEWLISILDLPHGIPQKDVYRRVLAALDPQAFQACFHEWIAGLRLAAEGTANVGRPILSIDGKTARRSHDRARGLGPLHSVSVWAGDFGLTLAQVACEEKSNEITAIPEALKLIDCKDAIVTIDAMGTQKHIAEQIIDAGGDYVLALKGNHEKLHQAVIEHIDELLEIDFQRVDIERHETNERSHGRQERRVYVQLPLPASLPEAEHWKGLASIGVAMLTTTRDDKTTHDARYYLSSLPVDVQEFARAVRGHWRIENGCHWILDMVYREDESRTRAKRLRENLSWLNRFTLSLLKQHPSKKSVATKRRGCACNHDFLLEVLTGQ